MRLGAASSLGRPDSHYYSVPVRGVPTDGEEAGTAKRARRAFDVLEHTRSTRERARVYAAGDGRACGWSLPRRAYRIWGAES